MAMPTAAYVRPIVLPHRKNAAAATRFCSQGRVAEPSSKFQGKRHRFRAYHVASACSSDIIRDADLRRNDYRDPSGHSFRDCDAEVFVIGGQGEDVGINEGGDSVRSGEQARECHAVSYSEASC